VSGPLRVERDGEHVVVLTLALPDVRNAMTPELTAAWADAVEALRRDRTVRCVVVTGEGRAFCAGGDLGWLASEPDATVDALRDRMLPFYETWLSLRALDVPSIAAVNGAAVGAGACLAMSCDIRYAGESAKFTVPFARLGMHAGMATTWLLPEIVGAAAARELLLTGRVVDAEEALRIGLVSRVFEPASFLDDVLEVATGIAANAPIATRLTKLALLDGGHADLEAALQWEALAQPITLATEDLQEGIRASREKRDPEFRGR
jgi:enoyl-CoA hydratase